MYRLFRLTLAIAFIVGLSGCSSCDGGGGEVTPIVDEDVSGFDAPTNIAASGAEKGKVDISWDIVTQADHYEIERCISDLPCTSIEKKFSPKAMYLSIKANETKLTFKDEPQLNPGTYKVFYLVSSARNVKNKFGEDELQRRTGKSNTLDFAVEKEGLTPAPKLNIESGAVRPPQSDTKFEFTPSYRRSDLTFSPKIPDQKLCENLTDCDRDGISNFLENLATNNNYDLDIAIFVDVDSQNQSGQHKGTIDDPFTDITTAISSANTYSQEKNRAIFIATSETSHYLISSTINLNGISNLSIIGSLSKKFDSISTDSKKASLLKSDKSTLLNITNSSFIFIKGLELEVKSTADTYSIFIGNNSNNIVFNNNRIRSIIETLSGYNSAFLIEKSSNIYLTNNIIISEKSQNNSIALVYGVQIRYSSEVNLSNNLITKGIAINADVQTKRIAIINNIIFSRGSDIGKDIGILLVDHTSPNETSQPISWLSNNLIFNTGTLIRIVKDRTIDITKPDEIITKGANILYNPFKKDHFEGNATFATNTEDNLNQLFCSTSIDGNTRLCSKAKMAIDKGKPISNLLAELNYLQFLLNKDIDGDIRQLDKLCDIGPDEFVAQQQLFKARSPSDSFEPARPMEIKPMEGYQPKMQK